MNRNMVLSTCGLALLTACTTAPPSYEANLYRRLQETVCHGSYPEGLPENLRDMSMCIRALMLGTIHTDPVACRIWSMHGGDPDSYPYRAHGIYVDPSFQPDDAPRLVEHLADRLVENRWVFAVELRSIADHRVVPALIERLGVERDYNVRMLLAMSLGHANDPKAVPVLEKVVRNPEGRNELFPHSTQDYELSEMRDNLVASALSALGDINHESAVSALVALQMDGLGGLSGLEASHHPSADHAIEMLAKYYESLGEESRSKGILAGLERRRREARRDAPTPPGSP
jgi:hypothetical protein